MTNPKVLQYRTVGNPVTGEETSEWVNITTGDQKVIESIYDAMVGVGSYTARFGLFEYRRPKVTMSTEDGNLVHFEGQSFAVLWE